MVVIYHTVALDARYRNVFDVTKTFGFFICFGLNHGNTRAVACRCNGAVKKRILAGILCGKLFVKRKAVRAEKIAVLRTLYFEFRCVIFHNNLQFAAIAAALILDEIQIKDGADPIFNLDFSARTVTVYLQ